jgi:hypothetical protein
MFIAKGLAEYSPGLGKLNSGSMDVYFCYFIFIGAMRGFWPTDLLVCILYYLPCHLGRRVTVQKRVLGISYKDRETLFALVCLGYLYFIPYHNVCLD